MQWGKRDTVLNLPTNDSLSVTLDTQDLHSRTTIRASPEYTQDRLVLNNTEVTSLSSNKRMQACLHALRSRRRQLEQEDGSKQAIADWHLYIVSMNNFPTAAGLASSASGYACLVYTLAQLYELVAEGEAPDWLTAIARQGSGSACRSLFGGYVQWQMGSALDGSDSHAVQVAPKRHWPEMRALILVTNAAKKDVSSSEGMQTTVHTSPLFDRRVKEVVPLRMHAMQQAIQERCFDGFAEVCMQDSNQFHAVCLDSFPPIFYLNDTSKRIIRLVHFLNGFAKAVTNDEGRRYWVAYTFDAGPNAVLYVEQMFQAFLAECLSLCGVGSEVRNVLKAQGNINENSMRGRAQEMLDALRVEPWNRLLDGESVQRVIATGVGDGPQRLGDSESLIASEKE